MEYIDNKKTMCWSKPDALFADASKEDEHPVSIPSLKDLPKMFNFEQGIGSNAASREDKNIFSQNRKKINPNSHVKLSNVTKKTKAGSNNVGDLTSKIRDSFADPHPPSAQYVVDESHSSSVYSSISKNATLKDLCAEDKQRIANLIQELGRISADKEKSRSTLEGERKLYESQIKKLLQRHDSVLTEKQKLQEQYIECFKIVLRYQENVAAATETSVASNEGSSRKVTNAKGEVLDNASVSLSGNGLVDQDVQTDVSQDEGDSSRGGGGKDETSGKDFSSSETQTSPILSRSMTHRISPKVESVTQIPVSHPVSLPEGSASHPPASHLYPRSHSPPFRQYYDQPPRNFDLEHSRVYSNYHQHPPSVPYYPGHPAYVSAIPLQMHRPDPVRHPYAHYPSNDWGTVPRPFLSQPVNVQLQTTSEIDGQVPSVLPPSHLAASTSVNPTSLEFATPPLHKETLEKADPEPKLPFDEGGETRFEPLVTDPSLTVARGTTPQDLAVTDSDSNPKNHSVFSNSGMNKLSKKTMSRKVAAKSNSKTPSTDDDAESTIRSSLSPTTTNRVESSEDSSGSTLRHLPSFGEDDSREKLMEIRAALKKEQEKLENRLTKQEKYIRKKEKELRRFAGAVKAEVDGNGKKTKEGEGEGGRGEDGGRSGRGKRNKIISGAREKFKVNSAIDKSCGLKLTKDLGNTDDDDCNDENDDVELIASLNCGQSGAVEILQRDRGGGGGGIGGRSKGGKVKSASKIVDLVDSLESSDKESEGVSWRRPLKSSTMIWDDGFGGGGLPRGDGGGGGLPRGDGGGDIRVMNRKDGNDKNGRSSRGDRPQDQKKKSRTKNRDVPSNSGRFNNQENELLDEIFFLR